MGTNLVHLVAAAALDDTAARAEHLQRIVVNFLCDGQHAVYIGDMSRMNDRLADETVGAIQQELAKQAVYSVIDQRLLFKQGLVE